MSTIDRRTPSPPGGVYQRTFSPSMQKAPHSEALPPVSNMLFEEFPDLKRADYGPVALKSECVQPYMKTGPATRTRSQVQRSMFLTTPIAYRPGTGNTTSFARFPGGGGGTQTFSSTMNRTVGSSSTYTGTAGGLLPGPRSQSTPPTTAQEREEEDWRRTEAHQHQFQGTTTTLRSRRNQRIPRVRERPEPQNYVTAHQQSCDLCHAEAVGHFVKVEQKLRQKESTQRAIYMDHELAERRAIFKEYVPLHTQQRNLLESKQREEQTLLAIKSIEHRKEKLERMETHAREELEIEMFRMLRAIRRCCYRRGWEKQAELDRLAAKELKRIKELEEAEGIAAKNERIRAQKLAAAMIKQLFEQENRERSANQSFEFKAWVRLLLQQKEELEQAMLETFHRLEHARSLERQAFENQMVDKRMRIDEEEKNGRAAIRLRFQKASAILKEKPIIAKMNDLPKKEIVSREQKVGVLMENRSYFLMGMCEEEQTAWRKSILKDEEKAFSVLQKCGAGFDEDLQQLQEVVAEESDVRSQELQPHEEAEWAENVCQEAAHALAAAEIVLAVLGSTTNDDSSDSRSTVDDDDDDEEK